MNNPRIKKRSNGSIYYKYWINEQDKYHRENGPALIFYYSNGKVKSRKYYLDNVLIKSYKEYKQRIKLLLLQ